MGSAYWRRVSAYRRDGRNFDLQHDNKSRQQVFAQHEVDFEAHELEVDLDSTGGDVDTAMQIGRIIRKYEGYTVVSPNDKCYSSCALIYSAGVRRFNHGVIGLHRPYFSSAPQSRQSIEREVPLMLQKLKAYVQEMGNTDIFYQEMVNTEPSAIKLYAGDDIKRIIPELDPTYDEVQTSYDAREYGVTTAEIRQRKKDAETCSGRSDAEKCRKAIYWGLSERVYENRKKNMHCVYTFEEVKSWELVKRKELKDHPSILKYEACVRNTMLGH
jgi:hypothetical protein